MTRLVPVTVLVVMLLAASGTASADMGSLPNGAVLAWDRLYIQDDSGAYVEPKDAFARQDYFNLAHCTCSKQSAGMQTKFEYRFALTGVTGAHLPAQFWVGTMCDVSTNRVPTMCRQLTSSPGSFLTIADIDSIATTETRVEFSLYDIMIGYQTGMPACPRSQTGQQIFLLASSMNNTTLDYSLVKNVGVPAGDTTATGIDTQPPPPPADVLGRTGPESIQLTWTVPTAQANDIAYYQALCANMDGTPALAKPSASPRYVAAKTLCGIANDPQDIKASTATSSDPDAMAIGNLPTGLTDLDPAYICGDFPTGTANNVSITGLSDDVPYIVLLLAIDTHGNAAGTYPAYTVTPHPVTDFWQDLHDHGSRADGGLCLIAETYGDDSGLTRSLRGFRDDTLGASRIGRWLGRAYYASLGKLGGLVHGSVALRTVAGVALLPVVAIALAWHALGLPGLLLLIGALALARRWRHRLYRALATRHAARAAATLAILGIALAPLRAHAGGFQPYWEDAETKDDDASASADDPDQVSWHVGVRIGPYTPDIDRQLGLAGPGPYQRMFGGSRLTPMLDVDRVVWTGFGQVAVGGTIGYMQRTADAYKQMQDYPDQRAPGASTHFRLLPLALAATYRFTWLDDRYGIPVVPYARAGLSYYIWEITKPPNGDIAFVCKDGTAVANCDHNRALGASLGLQGSIGLAIRAERIDPATAVSMRASGIQHAGIYGELSLAKVDGFGADRKLAVGDRTWFAGVDFEF